MADLTDEQIVQLAKKHLRTETTERRFYEDSWTEQAVDYHSAIPLVRAALAAAGVQAVDPWRASVKELLALLTEPAGFNVRLADDAERLGEFLDANEARIDSAAARARALLDGVGGPEHG